MSNKNKYKEKSEELAILTNLYGNILHTEIIYSVAQTQKWDSKYTSGLPLFYNRNFNCFYLLFG